MSTCCYRPTIALALFALSYVGTTASQEAEALLLPQDDRLYDDVTVRGSTERPLRSGLRRLTVRGSEKTYYVIDERDALHDVLHETFSDISRNDSDVSISYDQSRNYYIHFLFRPDSQSVKYLKVEPSLLVQTTEFFKNGGFSSGSVSVEFLEYQILNDACPNLGAAVERMEAVLLDVLSSIGPRQERSSTITVDGIGYGLRLRLGLFEASLSVWEDDGLLFEPIHSVVTIVRECSSRVEPEVKTREID